MEDSRYPDWDVLVFWDLENCPVPRDRHRLLLRMFREKVLGLFPGPIVAFQAYYANSKLTNSDVVETLTLGGVTCINAYYGKLSKAAGSSHQLGKGVAAACKGHAVGAQPAREIVDKAIIVDMLFQVADRAPKKTVIVLISGDGDYAPVLKRLRDRRHFVVVVPSANYRPQLADDVDLVIRWAEVLLASQDGSGVAAAAAEVGEAIQQQADVDAVAAVARGAIPDEALAPCVGGEGALGTERDAFLRAPVCTPFGNAKTLSAGIESPAMPRSPDGGTADSPVGGISKTESGLKAGGGRRRTTQSEAEPKVAEAGAGRPIAAAGRASSKPSSSYEATPQLLAQTDHEMTDVRTAVRARRHSFESAAKRTSSPAAVGETGKPLRTNASAAARGDGGVGAKLQRNSATSDVLGDTAAEVVVPITSVLSSEENDSEIARIVLHMLADHVWRGGENWVKQSKVGQEVRNKYPLFEKGCLQRVVPRLLQEKAVERRGMLGTLELMITPAGLQSL